MLNAMRKLKEMFWFFFILYLSSILPPFVPAKVSIAVSLNLVVLVVFFLQIKKRLALLYFLNGGLLFLFVVFFCHIGGYATAAISPFTRNKLIAFVLTTIVGFTIGGLLSKRSWMVHLSYWQETKQIDLKERVVSMPLYWPGQKKGQIENYLKQPYVSALLLLGAFTGIFISQIGNDIQFFSLIIIGCLLLANVLFSMFAASEFYSLGFINGLGGRSGGSFIVKEIE